MTYKEAVLAVFKGENPRQIVWQPRIENWYDVHKRRGTLPKKYAGMSLLELYDDLGCSPRPYTYARPSPEDLTDWGMEGRGGYCPQNSPPVLKINSGPDVKAKQIREGDLLVEVWQTPKGKLRRKWRLSEFSIVPYIAEFPVKKLTDLDTLEYILLNQEVVFDQEAYDEVERRIGDRAPIAMNVPRAPLQQLILFYLGHQDTIFALYDSCERIERFLSVAEEADNKVYEAIKKSPVKIVNFPDNVDIKFLSPSLFRRYLLPHYQKRTAELRQAGKFTDVHWDGNHKAILPYTHQTGFDGFEALTPLPQGDVTIDEIKEGLGDDLILLDGIPAIYFLSNVSEDTLVQTVRRLLELLAPKIILGISDELPANGEIERVRLISELIKDYNFSLSRGE